MTGLVHALLTWSAGGSALTVLVSLVGTVSAVVLGIIYRRYIGILGADRRRPAERQAYDALRNSLSGGNLAARLYVQSLTSFLNAVDRFFGDAGMADRTLFPHAFGLGTPAPLWTAPAFDRCLLLAFVYPIVTIFVIWAISGHVGPAEAALQLQPGVPGWRRALTVAAFALMTTAFFRFSRASGWRSLAWLAVALSGVIALSGVVVSAFALAVAGAGVVAFVVVWVNDESANRGWQGVFLSFFVVMTIMASVAVARLLSALPGWEIAGPLLLFLGLLTLLNAPFDWASLGLTRALLRRGLELRGWWPYFLALIDAALAAVVIVVLTLVIVIGVQTFDEFALLGGSEAVLPLDTLFNGIAANPWAPEYWWVYALLISSMIPSLTNLVIGGTSLMRGLPGLPSLLLMKIPDHGNVPKFDRAWISAVLTTQVALGAALGIAAQALLVVVIIGHVMPFFGLELLNMARGVAALNLPMRAWQLLTHAL